MKLFISYRSTGEDLKVLRHRMRIVVDALKTAGIDYYVNAWEHERFRSSGMTRRQIIDEGLAELDKCTHLLVLLMSDDKSEGLLLEVGYAYAKHKPLIVARRDGIATTLDAMAEKVILWHDLDDLRIQLEKFRL